VSETTPRRLVAHGAVAELIDDPARSPVGLALGPTLVEPEFAPGGPTLDPVDRDDLGRQVRGGMRWSLLNSVLLRFLNVAVSIVMARLLVPEDYGLYAVGTVVLMVLQSMNELGTSVAVVRWQGDVTRAARTATTLAYGSSFLLWGTTFLLAPAVADALNAPDATSLLRVLSFSVLIDAVSAIPNALLTRGFMQRQRAIVDGAGLVLSSAISITLATRGWGAMSLACGALAGNVLCTTLICRLAPAFPRPGWNRTDAEELLRVGLPLAGTSLVFLAILNVDYIVVGRELDPEQLGYYLLAFNLSSWPPNILSVAVRRVAVPAFARLADDRDALDRAFARAVSLLGMISLLAAVLLSTLGPELIHVVYRPRWAPAVEALRWLAVLGAGRVLIDLAYDALAAVGRTRRLLALQVAWIVALIPALAIGTRDGGIRGAAIAHVVVAVGVVIPLYVLALGKVGIRPASLAAAMGRVLVATGASAAAVLACGTLELGELGTLAAGGLTGTVVFLAIAVRPDDRRLTARWVDERLASGRLRTPRHMAASPDPRRRDPFREFTDGPRAPLHR
jgi:O-antigen/teichoic acid export membrane protein